MRFRHAQGHLESLIAAYGDQEWVADASAIVFCTSMRARPAWKYDMGRAPRILLLDVGHLSRTVYCWPQLSVSA